MGHPWLIGAYGGGTRVFPWRAGAPDPSFFYERAQFEEYIRGYEEYQRKEQLLQEEAESGLIQNAGWSCIEVKHQARHYEEIVGWDSEQ